MRESSTLSRDEIFRRLRELGAATAVVEFSGGGDEGGIDSITLYDGEGNALDVELEENFHGRTWQPITQTYVQIESATPDQELAAALTAPVYARYGSFDGDLDVNGTISYDVAAGSVKMKKFERVYEGSEEDL
jgi:hypothetical protein